MERIQHTKHRSSQQGALLAFLVLIIVLAAMGWFWAKKSGHLVDLKHDGEDVLPCEEILGVVGALVRLGEQIGRAHV